MKKQLNPLLLATAILLLYFVLSHNGFADELVLKNGSHLVGKIINKNGNSIKFETPFAGVIKVNWENVLRVTSDTPLKLLLKDQSVRTTQIIEKQKQQIILTQGQEQVSIPQSELAYINPAPWQLGESYKISGAFNVALKYQDGNTDKHEFEADGTVKLRRLNNRFKFTGEYEDAENLGEKTAKSWLLSGQYDHFFTEKTFYGLNFLLEQDDFADLELRQTYGIHVGHQYFETPSKHLSIRAGISQTFEDFKQADNEDYLALTWGIDYAQFIIPDRMEFYHRHEGQLSLENADKYIIKSWTGLRFPIANGFSISTEAQLDYDSQVTHGVDKTDATYLVKLGYDF